MTQFNSTRIVPFTSQQMFDLVADVEKYPLFVPMCTHLTVLKRFENEGLHYLQAEMSVGYQALREKFLCRVALDEPHMTINVDYLSGPFKRLDNVWHFKPHEKGCEVSFFIDYEFKSRTFGIIASLVMDKSFKLFAQKFEERAGVVYRI